jgi:hypothetical protein
MPQRREQPVGARVGLARRNKPTAILDLAVSMAAAKPFLQVAPHWAPARRRRPNCTSPPAGEPKAGSWPQLYRVEQERFAWLWKESD